MNMTRQWTAYAKSLDPVMRVTITPGKESFILDVYRNDRKLSHHCMWYLSDDTKETVIKKRLDFAWRVLKKL